jgi:hypothetical protein
MARTPRRALTTTTLTLALALTAASCSHAPPRGPIATTRAGVAPAQGSCDEAQAPYLAELCGMGEPSLSVPGPETYRFMWLRHLRNPVAVRVAKTKDGVTITSVQADAHDPSKKRTHEITAGPEVWTELAEHVKAADFWNLAGDPEEDDRGLDGADWIVEGRKAGIYHAVIRWEPKNGPFRDVCEDIIKISGLSFPAEIR